MKNNPELHISDIIQQDIFGVIWECQIIDIYNNEDYHMIDVLPIKKINKGEINMFKNALAGDRVWSIPEGWGTIKIINDEALFGKLKVVFDNGRVIWFNNNGKYQPDNIYPTLFWDEIKFDIPKPPKRKEIDQLILEEHNQFKFKAATQVIEKINELIDEVNKLKAIK
jgi:hypothetical protein